MVTIFHTVKECMNVLILPHLPSSAYACKNAFINCLPIPLSACCYQHIPPSLPPGTYILNNRYVKFVQYFPRITIHVLLNLCERWLHVPLNLCERWIPKEVCNGSNCIHQISFFHNNQWQCMRSATKSIRILAST